MRREWVWFCAMMSGVLVLVAYSSAAVCMTIYLAASGEVGRAAIGLAASVVVVPTMAVLLVVQLDRLADWQIAARAKR